MAVTGFQMSERDGCLRQIERLLNSHTFHGSESLRKLLRYLADHALDHPGLPVKEYQIATEVFGRPADFDPQSDSTIRVQAGRLRLKLSEYYASEGIGDAILVEMPKGSYVVSFHHRDSTVHVSSIHEVERPEAVVRHNRVWSMAVIALSTLLLVAVALIIGLVRTHNAANAAAPVAAEPVPEVLQTFWRGFASGSEEPWVIFSNGAFTGRPETGMRYFDPGRDSREKILDHYTGVGEVLAVHNLDHVFELLHRQMRVKRGSLFSLDDAQNNDLIFVGSPAENLTLREITASQEFVFQRLASGPRKGDLAVVNVHPEANEPKTFLASPSGSPLTEEYAVIALARGMNPSRSQLILAGTTTIGTQAAAEFVCWENNLEKLVPRLRLSKDREVTPFEALLKVKVARGVPVSIDVVALRSSPQ
jgi:hypothetical protein